MVFHLNKGGSLVDKIDLPAFSLSGTYCHKIGTKNPSCQSPGQPTIHAETNSWKSCGKLFKQISRLAEFQFNICNLVSRLNLCCCEIGQITRLVYNTCSLTKFYKLLAPTLRRVCRRRHENSIAPEGVWGHVEPGGHLLAPGLGLLCQPSIWNLFQSFY